MMYLRTGALIEGFVIETRNTTIDAQGRSRSTFVPNGTISAILTSANARQVERWNQLQHPVTHQIVQRGRPRIKEESRLRLGQRLFHIQGIETFGELGLWTVYSVEERHDDGN